MSSDLNSANLQKKIEEIQSSKDHKVCVVGIIGRCHLFQKDQALNMLVDHDVFTTNLHGAPQDLEENRKQVEVKMFYDEEQKTIFLELNTIHDVAQLIKACKRLSDNLSMAGHHRYWQHQILQNASALLFMFSVCHIIVVMFPTPRFELSFLRLFKVLASARYNTLHSLSQTLGGVKGITDIWRTTGRPCIPRIVFSFQTPWRHTKGLNENSMRKLQQSLQDQLHLILKKNRLLGSLSSSSLFTISSPNQLFVHIQSPQHSYVDPVSFCINHVLKNSLNVDMLLPSSRTNHTDSNQSSPTKSLNNDNDFATSKRTTHLREFLYKQIDYMMTVESREAPTEGRRGTHVEAPSILLWYRVCQVAYDYFLGPTSDNNAHIKALAQTLDLDWKFSENRCHKVTPMATSAYLDNLPSHYIQSVHMAQLSHSLHVFAMNARGPACEHFANQLQEECNQIWWNGRHLCEATSMTGQPCVYPFHNVPDGSSEQLEEKTGVPLKYHSSRVTSISACDCGRTQGTREDPFDFKTANFDFYQDLEKKCCSYLTHIKMICFPVDDPSIIADTAPTLQKRLETHQFTILGRNTALKQDNISSSLKQDNMSSLQPGKEGNTEIDNFTSSNSSSTLIDKNISTSITSEDKTISSSVMPQEKLASSSVTQQDKSVFDLADGRTRSNSFSRDFITSDVAASLSTGFQSVETAIESRDIESGGVSYVSEYEGMIPSKPDTLDGNELKEDTSTVQQQQQEQQRDDENQAQTQQHFEGMFTVNLPCGILPLFPSWSLIVLGSANLYNPMKGVDQVGFFTGSNYLLLWDIPIKSSELISSFESNEENPLKNVGTDEEQWPAPGEVQQQLTSTPPTTSSYIHLCHTVNAVRNQTMELHQSERSNKSKRTYSTSGTKDSPTLKAYIGNEYECPRGHRFFCSAPDKMVKASASGHVRENATKLVSANMPLYFPCPCRSSKPLHLAQLTRTYVVTPDSSVTITLNPRVQPGERDITPVFVTGIRDGITLPPNSYCVLRYPYVYIDENGPILPPAQSQPLLTCRLLRGMFNYSHVISNEDT